MTYKQYITHPYPDREVAEALILRLHKRKIVATDFVRMIADAYEIKPKDEHSEEAIFDMLVTVYEAGVRSGKRIERIKKALKNGEVTAND